ncbi:hypothetical protein LCGC14_1593980 [marine sediment metagenome]|uniref:CMP/dCMP-type deaminase domain-containing protein n=1 Tax=marine sediment metagenome TaxID=412755 RepID=A0A0F9ID66_9ZZZZ
MEHDWDSRYLQLARLVSTWSKDPSTQTGAVITNDKHRVVSVGFNGFPQKIADDDRLQNRAVKYEMIIHAEINSLIFAGQSLEGCTLYTYPFLSCSRCASIMIQAGIKRVVAPIIPRFKR